MNKNQKCNDASEIIMKDIENKRNKWQDECLNEVRIRGSKSLSMAIWRYDLNLAQIEITRGQNLKSVGIFIKGVQYLYPEECLSLVERGKLVVFNTNEDMLSIQDLYELLVESGVKISTYQVYHHLKRLGYIIFRHNEEEEVKNNNPIILYDVYEPDKSFSRKNPGPVSFLLCISDDKVKFEDLMEYLERYKPTPIKLGIYSSGNIPSFYTIES